MRKRFYSSLTNELKGILAIGILNSWINFVYFSSIFTDAYIIMYIYLNKKRHIPNYLFLIDVDTLFIAFLN